MKSMVTVLPAMNRWPDTATEPDGWTVVGETEISGDAFGDERWLGVAPGLGVEDGGEDGVRVGDGVGVGSTTGARTFSVACAWQALRQQMRTSRLCLPRSRIC